MRICHVRKIMEIWQEHFEEVLDVPSEETELPDGCITQENRNTETDKTPIREELIRDQSKK
jgi:hypothetical protein